MNAIQKIIQIKHTRKTVFMYSLAVLGLSIGLAIFIVTLLFFNRERNYDQWDSSLNQVYRLINQNTWDGEPEISSFSPPALAPYLLDHIPEVQGFTTVRELSEVLIQVDDHEFYDFKSLQVDSNFFKIFPYPFLLGNSDQALKNPREVVISRVFRDQWYPDIDPVGHVIDIQGRSFTIQGVFDQIGPSHLDIHMVLSTHFDVQNWNARVVTSYVRISPHAVVDLVEEKASSAYTLNIARSQQASGSVEANDQNIVISDFQSANEWLEKNSLIKNIEIILEPISSIHLGALSTGWRDALSNHPILDINPEGEKQLWIFSGMGFLVLFLSIFNFTNVQIVLGNEQAKNAGIRKILGSSKAQLVKESFKKAFLQVCIAFIIALLFSYGLTVYFNKNYAMELNLWQNEWPAQNVVLIVQCLAIILVILFISSIYPAWILANFKPVQLLRGELKSGQPATKIRNILVVGQFALAIVFIGCFIIIRSQLKFMLENDPGFKTEQILRIDGNHLDIGFFENLDENESLMNQLRALPAIEKLTSTHYYPGKLSHSEQTIQYGKDTDTLTALANWVGLGYFEILNIPIYAGRSFSKEHPMDSKNGAIINETAAKKMRIEQPIGHKISALGMEYEIIGISHDIYLAGYEKIVQPELYIIGTLPNLTSGRKEVLIELSHLAKTSETLEQIHSIWKKNGATGPLVYTWLDDDFGRLFKKYQTLDQLAFFICLLSIFIASMGMFTLSLYSIQNRVQEIGIRKILGASVNRILRMLYIDFGKLVLIAFLIASPIIFWLMSMWLQNFAYRIDIKLWMVASAGFVSLVIVILVVTVQAWRSVNEKVVDTLRNE